ncbi:hypothetical protein L5515_001357 [Caenorhabditis briggsae]|uniref:Protein SON n=1 Tax=Caenorhabditis briggsae TaxID=6238 RepID=A0AAE9E2R2_CAEBR|nr:hypothetical protein L5515_001357 [Caenorhabditis briggsae]
MTEEVAFTSATQLRARYLRSGPSNIRWVGSCSKMDNGENAPKNNSEAIIADLLNDLKSSEKMISVDKIARCDDSAIVEDKRKKSHKHRSSHRSKKSKKERRKRSRTWSDSSRSRSRSRNHSRERKKHHKKRKSRSRSRSRSSRVSQSALEKEKPHIVESKAETKLPTPPKELHSEEKSHESLTDPGFSEASKQTSAIILPEVNEETKTKVSIVLPLVEENSTKKDIEDGEIEDFVYGPADAVFPDHEENTNDKKDSSNGDIVEVKKESKDRKEKDKNKKKDKSDRKRKSSVSNHDSKKKDRKDVRRRSRSRERERLLPRRRSPSPFIERKLDRTTRRSVSRERRSRSSDRITRWRSQSRERRDFNERRRRRSRSREVIDKDKLLAIAKTKRAEMMSHGDRDNASIEDFVTYCKKLQKRQEREKRREAGQAVSDHDSDGETVRYKHPYAMPKDPIRINIVTATSASLAQKDLTGPEEPTQLPASQLRIVYPVSSGEVHRENAEWIPVEKEDVPKSCSVEQKKHVALTSLEIDRCRAQGIPVAPVPVPKFLNSILPPPPMPPQFMPNPSDPFRPPTPPSLPSVLYVPTKDKMILKEPKDITAPAPSDIGKVLKKRTEAQGKVLATPNDFEAHRALKEANEQIKLWAALKSLPGEYTGTTGLRLLSADELQPHNPKFHAWVKKDQFRNAAPATTGIGRMMLEKMGWRPGEGLGKGATGNVEPLVLDVKSDRKGLMAEVEMSTKQRNKMNTQNNVPIDLSTKNPISLVMELCAKRRWNAPSFTCEESGADHSKMFIWTVVINNVQYRPMCGSKQKKEGKAVACQVALQSLGVLPRDPDHPVCM